jgi:hypothetical protein
MKNEAKLRWFLPDFSETTTIENLIYYSKNYSFIEEWKAQNTWVSTNTEKPKTINYFTEPYNNGTQNSKIWDLQDMLRHYGFYEWELTNTYDKKTVNAVHNFQVAMWILDKNDTKSAARWWMWPSTRNKLNEKRTEFQEFKKNEELKMKNQ